MIFVTGGLGFIGSNFILEWFNNSNEKLINLDRITYAADSSNLLPLKNNNAYKFYKGDINDKVLVENILKEYNPRAIIHFAAESHVDTSIKNPKVFVESNVLGTFNLLNISYRFVQNNNRFKNFKFIHISTDEVFGSLKPDDKPFTEETPYKPNSPYSASKASSDHFVRSFYHTFNFPVITINSSNNYGPFQNVEKFIPNCIRNAFLGKTIPIYGNGNNIRDWLYVKDHCRAINMILEKGVLGQTYNIGGCSEKTNIETATTICKILDKIQPKKNGTSYTKQINFVKDRPGHDFRYSVDISKIKNDLGWEPYESFYNGLEKTISWYLSNLSE